VTDGSWKRDVEVGEWWAAGSRTPTEALDIRRGHHRRARALIVGPIGADPTPQPAAHHHEPAPRPDVPTKPAAKRVAEGVAATDQRPETPQVASSGSGVPRSGWEWTGNVRRILRTRRGVQAVAAIAVTLTLAVTTLIVWPGSPQKFPGVVEYPDSVQLNFPQSGQIAAINVQTGDVVYQGEPLATEANPAATSELSDLKRVLLADEAVLSAIQAQPGVTEDKIATAEATVESAQASYDQALVAVQNLTLTSPIAGRVAIVNGAVGETVPGGGGPSSSVSGATASSPQPLIAVTAGPPVVVALVAQQNAVRLRPGSPGTVQIAALGRQEQGTIAHIGTVPVSTDGTVSYRVEVILAHWPPGILPGMTIRFWAK
jgi:multidrug efflux pump subunit AcrA (membrane-fusion protein)